MSAGPHSHVTCGGCNTLLMYPQVRRQLAWMQQRSCFTQPWTELTRTRRFLALAARSQSGQMLALWTLDTSATVTR